MSTETDRAVLVAQALAGYEDRDFHDKYLSYSSVFWKCARCGAEWYECGSLTPPEGMERPAVCKRTPPTLDVSILPAIWADCEARGFLWTLQSQRDGKSVVGEVDTFIARDPDPVLAMVDAWLKARGM